MKYWVNKQTRRYYRVHLDRDLLGDLTLTRSWEGLDSRLGRIKNEFIPDVNRDEKSWMRSANCGPVKDETVVQISSFEGNLINVSAHGPTI